MSGDDGDGGNSGHGSNHFDALFAAAEASIDRLKAEKHRDEFDDDVPDDSVNDDQIEEVGLRPGPSPIPPAPRPGGAKAPLPTSSSASRTKPRLPPGPLRSQGMPSKPPASAKASSNDQALTAALIKARNELSTLVERQKAEHAKEVAQLRARIEQLKSTQGTTRQRSERERNSAVDREREKVLKTLLPVIDNLERALSADLESIPTSARPALEGVTTGIENVIRLAQSSLKQLGVEAFDSVGQPFDPERHEAIRRESRTDVADNTVIEEYHKGYHMNGRLLRAALVVVAQGGK